MGGVILVPTYAKGRHMWATWVGMGWMKSKGKGWRAGGILYRSYLS